MGNDDDEAIKHDQNSEKGTRGKFSQFMKIWAGTGYGYGSPSYNNYGSGYGSHTGNGYGGTYDPYGGGAYGAGGSTNPPLPHVGLQPHQPYPPPPSPASQNYQK